MSKRETILAAVKTALSGTSNVSTRIYRSRVEPLQRAEFPALVIEPINDTATREAVGRLDWDLLFVVTVLARADVPDSSADSTVADVHSKIMSNSPLAALLVDLVPVAVEFNFQEADQPLGIIGMQFRATYQTAENSIS